MQKKELKPKNKGGRPRVEINWLQFEELCNLQCTQTEIASVLHIHVDTLCDRTREQYGMSYSEAYKKFSEGGKSSLRRNQFKLSATNASLAIWLGKIWLGQVDPGISDAKEDLLGELKRAIREIEGKSGVDETERPPLADKQPLLD